MLQQDVADDYVIATGETHTVQEFLEVAAESLDMDWRAVVTQDPRHLRPAEVDLLLGDPGKARRVLGWEPKVSFRGLVQMMCDADMALAQQEAR
jgi:GDPmannose 4,6-dehydratase